MELGDRVIQGNFRAEWVLEKLTLGGEGVSGTATSPLLSALATTLTLPLTPALTIGR